MSETQQHKKKKKGINSSSRPRRTTQQEKREKIERGGGWKKRGRFLIVWRRERERAKSPGPQCTCERVQRNRRRKAGRLCFRHEKPTSLQARRFSIQFDSSEAWPLDVLWSWAPSFSHLWRAAPAPARRRRKEIYPLYFSLMKCIDDTFLTSGWVSRTSEQQRRP